MHRLLALGERLLVSGAAFVLAAYLGYGAYRVHIALARGPAPKVRIVSKELSRTMLETIEKKGGNRISRVSRNYAETKDRTLNR